MSFIRTLNTAFGASPVPSYAGNRTNPWSPNSSLYNFKASNTRNLRDNAATAASGQGLCRVAFLGDSITAGYQSSPGVTDPVALFTKLLSRRGLDTAMLLHAYDNIAGDFAGVDTSRGGGAANKTFPWVDITTGSVSFTGSGSVLEILFSDGGSPFTYSIDGAAPVTVTPGNTTGVATATVTGLSAGTHSVVIARSGTTGTVYVYAAGFRPVTGFLVENSGIYGATTTDWLSTVGNYGYGLLVSLLSTGYAHRNAVFIELGVNDYYTGIPVPIFKSQLTTIVQNVQAVDADAVLVVANRPNRAAGWDAFASAIYDVADAQDTPLLDLTDWFGPLDEMQQEGQDFDGTHLTPKGSAHQAQAYGGVVQATGGTVTALTVDGWHLAGFNLLAAAANTTGAVQIGAFDELMVVCRIPSMSSADIPALRFNGDTGASYWSRYLTSAAGGITLVNAQTLSTTMARLSGSSNAGGRTITAIIGNKLANGKSGAVAASMATGVVAAAGVLDVAGQFEWVNTTAQVSSVELLSAGGVATFPVGTGLMVFGRNFA